MLFISRDACSNSVAKLLCACFCCMAQLFRNTLQMGYRTDVPVQGEVSRHLGEC